MRSRASLVATLYGPDSRPGPATPAALTWPQEPRLPDALEPQPDAAVYVLGELGLVRSVRQILAERAFPKT